MPDVMASSELLMESVEQQGQEMLAHTAARAIHAGVPHVMLLKWGNVAETILQTVAEEQCDLIVLGSRGLSGFERLMLGSISNAVAAKPMSGPGDQAAASGALALASCPCGHRRFSWSDAAVDHAIELARVQQLEVCLLYVDQRRSRRMDSLFSLTSDGKKCSGTG